MAQLRLIAFVAALGCRASEAGPTSGLTAPAGWRPMPALATAVSDAAKQAKATVDGAEAWGEPSRGCYATWLALHTTAADPAALAPRIVDEIRADLGEVRDVVLPTATSSALSLRFTRAAYEGTLRAQLATTGAITVLACFWNAREPKACEAACGSIK